MKARVVTSGNTLKKAVQEEVEKEWAKRQERMQRQAQFDVMTQFLGAVLWTLRKNHGWGKRRMRKFLGELSALFHWTDTGAEEVLGQSVTLLNVITELKNEIGIDVDEEVREMQ